MALPASKPPKIRTGASAEVVADAVFRAFSDRTRLRILHLLCQGTLCVNDLIQVLRVPQPTASRHLAYLRRVGLVTVEKRGPWVHYSLAPASNRFHQKLLDCLESCFEELPELRQDLARAEKVRHSSCCCKPLD